MALPLVGAQAVLAGVPQFNKDADTVNSKVGAIHQAMGGLGGIANQAGGAVSSAFKGMALAGAGAVAGVGAVGGSILKLAYDAANLPGIESVFKNMTNSMSVDADALMGKMRAASYGAVKDFDLMQSANKAMVGAGKDFGKMFAESLPTLMQVSREAAKGQGMSVEYMYDSIVTGIKRMSPMILDNLGFQISLGEAQDKYAAKIGKTSAELTKEEKQMALLNEVTRLGTQLIEESGGHVDSVQKSVMAWGTAWKNIKDRVGIELLPILQKFMDLIGKPGQGMQDAIIQVTSNFVNWLLPAIDKVATAISALLNGPLAMLIKGFSSIGLGGLATLGESLAAIFSGGNIDTGAFSDTLTKALTPMLGADVAGSVGKKAADIAVAVQAGLAPIRGWIDANVVPAFDTISGVLQGVRDTIQGGDFPWEDVLPPGLAAMAYDLVDSLKGLKEAAGWYVTQLGVIIGQAFSGDFGAAFDNLKQTFSILLDDIFGPGAGDQVLGFIGTMVTAFNDNLPTILDLFGQLSILWTNVSNTILAVATAVWPSVQAVITTVWDVISQTLTIFYTQIFPVLLSAFETILSWVNANWPQIQSIIVTVFTAINDIVVAVIGAVGPFIITTFQGIADWVTANWPYIQETIGLVLNFILALVQSTLDAISQFWTDWGWLILEVVNAIWENIKVIISAAIAIIQQIIMIIMAAIHGDWQKVWDGIVSILRIIWETIKTLVNTSLGVLKTVLAAAWVAIKEKVTTDWNAIKDFLSDLWTRIQTMFNDNVATLKKTISDALESIKKTWQDIWNGIADIVLETWERIKQIVVDGINDVISLINDLIDKANKVMGTIGLGSPIPNLEPIRLARGGILNRPVFLAGEAGAEVVAPLRDLLDMISTSIAGVFNDNEMMRIMPYGGSWAPWGIMPTAYSGPVPVNNYNYGGDTYVREYNLTTQSIVRPGGLVLEFTAMEMGHL